MEKKMKQMKIGFKPLIDVNIIFSFDNKEQSMSNIEWTCTDINKDESELIRELILIPYYKEQYLLKDLYKVSMCFSCKEEDFKNLPIMKKVFSRNAKYYFDPKQRDQVEDKIIKGTTIASETKPFLMVDH